MPYNARTHARTHLGDVVRVEAEHVDCAVEAGVERVAAD
eukprot:SAG22_NODE_2758_length_2239_cov_1.881776_1_plen_38_part_10